MTTEPETQRPRWDVTIDLRDVMFGAGALIAVGGAAIIHPGLAVVALGAALAGAAWMLARKR